MKKYSNTQSEKLKIFLVIIIIVSTVISLYLKISSIKKGFDVVEFGFGAFFLSLGLLGLLAWVLKIEYKLFYHLAWYKETGGKFGIVSHFIRYVVIPIIFGLFLILK